MAEIKIKVDVPPELAGKFETALEKVVEQFTRRVRFSVIDEIMSKSKLTDEQINKLSSEAKERTVKKHGW
ncbi:hypothetical protein HY449_04030 [Candidatus Pacearchaeota archaeon]|nr:hypothetical protein [Candidatus Pacearchaeota archaeon]